MSRLPPETAEIAAALGRHARQGRDLRLAVLSWFSEAGLASVLDTTVPEPPEQAVLAALEHVTAASLWYQLFTQSRAAQTETQQDEFYAAAAEAATALPATAERFDAAAIRAALLTGQQAQPEVQPVRDSMVQLLAATGMGHTEVGADALAEAISGSGLFPPVSARSCEQWLARLRQPEASSPLAELLVTRYDPVAMIRVASGEQLHIARKVAFELADFHAGIPVDEVEERINASERTQLLAGFALSAATRTAWEDKVRTLGRSLAAGLLADDNAKIDTEQMIIAAITDIEGPQLAMLELLVRWYPCQFELEPDLISGPLDIPGKSGSDWHVRGREWPYPLIAYARPNLLPIAPSLLGTLQRHGLIVQNNYTDVELDRYQNERFFKELADAAGGAARTGSTFWPLPLQGAA